jgi:hypothetical protein
MVFRVLIVTNVPWVFITVRPVRVLALTIKEVLLALATLVTQELVLLAPTLTNAPPGRITVDLLLLLLSVLIVLGASVAPAPRDIVCRVVLPA